MTSSLFSLIVFALVLVVVCSSSAQSTTTTTTQVKPAAYYYPWHSNGFHNNEGYLRKFINQRPKLGEYDDRNPDVIKQHIRWSEQANIKVWITSWWGPNSREDITLRSTILPTLMEERTKLEFAIFYETTNRIHWDDDDITTNNIINDMNYICDHYVTHPNYYRIDGRPVLVIYLTRYLEQKELLEDVILLMRSAAAKKGYNFYLIGDHAFDKPPSPLSNDNNSTRYSAFDYLDAVTNYDVYGSIGTTPYAGDARLEKYYLTKQMGWKNAAQQQNCAFIPGITPGFNDRGIRPELNRIPLSRKLNNASDTFGSLFETSLQYAMTMVDSNADNLLLITSFNEYHEDTQIEPVIGSTTANPMDYTYGLDYEGYDTKYLDILKDMTSPTSISESPSLSPTTPTGDGKCIICKDEQAPWMILRNISCKSLVEANVGENCKLSSWVNQKYCQYSCFVAGVGYPGDNCYICGGDGGETVSPSIMPSSSSTATTTTITTPPTSISTTSRPSIVPIITPVPTVLPTTISPTTPLPTPSPTISPTANNNCILCDDIGNSWMVDVGRECKLSINDILVRKCNKNGVWRKNKHCRYSCYHAGFGYDGDTCCI